ncbi:hypothetical protein AMS68_001628 [Peltaster fructicola]|uniref:Cutinase n=1 Tax=Peltaster fructicola TaxID=286661 RepID=A0A6H0XN84_9PEZI|nr:hypothetical protein AMS68_001628 [Peltaster fructicola]
MFSKAVSALAALALLRTASAQSSSSTYSADLSTSTACPSKGGVHIIVARGSLEAPPYGVQVATKDKILAMIPGSTADGTIGYPDTLTDYINSETSGAIIARGLITDYVSRCPGQPLVLTGYSQGAHILGDALIGQANIAFPPNASVDGALPDSTLAQVAALVFLGDPSFVLNETFLVGNATKNGVFPRNNSALFDNTGLSSRAQTYCDYDDEFCANGASLAVHVSYLPRVSDSIVDFVVKSVAAWYAANPSTGSSSSVSSGAVSARASASQVSACRSVASKTGVRTASATVSRVTQSATPSSTTSPSTAVSTGAASSFAMGMTVAAGAGAAVAGLFAALL